MITHDTTPCVSCGYEDELHNGKPTDLDDRGECSECRDSAILITVMHRRDGTISEVRTAMHEIVHWRRGWIAYPIGDRQHPVYSCRDFADALEAVLEVERDAEMGD